MSTDFYTQFYAKIENSTAHAAFCTNVFGVDLNQHGFADIEQLEMILEISAMSSGQSVLDIGCGNGKIAEYLSLKSGAQVTGIDNCTSAILQAQRKTKDLKLRFQQGDINELGLPDREFDSTILIDSIYFSNDYSKTLLTLKKAMKRTGMLLLFYSIGPALMGSEDFPIEILDADKTPLAISLKEAGLRQSNIDLTEKDLHLAKIRKNYLEENRESFNRDGIEFIYENRMDESDGIITAINACKHRRYLYWTQNVQS